MLRSPHVRAALAVVLVAVGVRWLARGVIGAVLQALGMHYFDPAAWSYGWAFGLLVGGLATAAFGAFLLEGEGGLRGASGGGLLAGSAVVAVLMGGVYAYHVNNVLNWNFTVGREPGVFPFEAGRAITFERSGYVGVAHIGDDGFRVCGPDGASGAGARRVSLYGDSMVFGLGVPDEASMCWRLRAAFEERAPGSLTWSNRGQPGANIHSLVDTMHYAEARWPSDVAVVGVLIPDDGQVLDVNSHRVLRGQAWVHLGAVLIGPDLVFSGALAFVKAFRAELLAYASLVQGLDDLAAASEALGMQTVWFLWDDPHRNHAEHGMLDAWDARMTTLADKVPTVTYLGVLSEPPSPPDAPYRIPNDGHQTTAGVQVLVPAWRAAIDRALQAAP